MPNGLNTLNFEPVIIPGFLFYHFSCCRITYKVPYICNNKMCYWEFHYKNIVSSEVESKGVLIIIECTFFIKVHKYHLISQNVFLHSGVQL